KLAGYIKKFFRAIDDNNYQQQWILMETMRKIHREPSHLERFFALLVQEHIHPVVKTAVFQWLQELDIPYPVTVHKLELELTVEPAGISKVDEHPIEKEARLMISELEQENPALYLMLNKLLYQYIYVRYPIMPASSDVPYIAEALVAIGKERLNLP